MMRRRRALDDLEHDLREHIDSETERNIERGMTADEARRAALLAFGNPAIVGEDTRAVWHALWAQQLAQDLRYALRSIRRHPGVSAAVGLTLALAVGMTAAVFGVFNAVLLRPLPYPDAERLVWLSLDGDTPFGAIPANEFAAWRDQATSFDGMMAYEGTQNHTWQSADGGTQVRNAWISSDFWPLTGATVVHGRLPAEGEEDAIVLAHAFFERWFHGTPEVVGRTATVNGRPLAIAGVLASDFRFLLPQEALGPTLDRRDIDIYRLYGSSQSPPSGSVSRGGGVPVRVVAKLKPAVTVEQARAELETIRARLAESRPVPSLDEATLSVVPLRDQLVGEARRAIWMLMAAVSFVLLIACANIAGLLLARGAARRREAAVRASIGASRGRLVRQSLAESFVLAMLGIAAGVALAHGALHVLSRLVPPEIIPRLADATIDMRVLAFVIGLAVLVTILFGLTMAAPLSRVTARDALRAEGNLLRAGPARARGRQVLVAVQLAATVVLLTGAGLMLKSFWRMHAHPPGFDPARVLTMKFMFVPPTYVDVQRRMGYVEEMLRAVESLPEVEHAGITAVGGASPLAHVYVEGMPRPPVGEPATFHAHAASAGYASAMGLRLMSGRWLTDVEPIPVAVISERVARRVFGTAEPVGRRIQLAHVAAPGLPEQPFIPVVGVVADLKSSRLDADPEPTIYLPYRHYPRAFASFAAAIRTVGDPMAAAAPIRTRLLEVDRTLPVFDVLTLEHVLAESIAPRRFNLLLLGAFAMAALVLALIGISGVLAHIVARRTPEIGIRMALGASRLDVLRMIVRQGMTPALAGIAIGVTVAASLTRVFATLLYDVQPADVPTFLCVVALLLAASLAACCGPAVRAAFANPARILRSE